MSHSLIAKRRSRHNCDLAHELSKTLKSFILLDAVCVFVFLLRWTSFIKLMSYKLVTVNNLVKKMSVDGVFGSDVFPFGLFVIPLKVLTCIFFNTTKKVARNWRHQKLLHFWETVNDVSRVVIRVESIGWHQDVQTFVIIQILRFDVVFFHCNLGRLLLFKEKKWKWFLSK